MYGPDLDLCLITILNECCLHILCGPACDVNIDDPHGRYRSEPSGADVPAPSSPRCKIPDGGNAESAQGLGGSSVLLIPVSSLLFIPSIFPTAHYLPLMLLSTSTVPLERQRARRIPRPLHGLIPGPRAFLVSAYMLHGGSNFSILPSSQSDDTLYPIYDRPLAFSLSPPSLAFSLPHSLPPSPSLPPSLSPSPSMILYVQ